MRPSTTARVPLPLHYRGERIVTRLHAGLHRLHALDLPKRRWRHLSRHMTILTLLQNIHGDRLRRNTRGTYRIIIRRNRPLLPRKHFRCVGCMTRRTVENHVSSESHWEGGSLLKCQYRMATASPFLQSAVELQQALLSFRRHFLQYTSLRDISIAHIFYLTTWEKLSRWALLSIVGGKRLSCTRYGCHWSLLHTLVDSDVASDLPSILPIDRLR